MRRLIGRSATLGMVALLLLGATGCAESPTRQERAIAEVEAVILGDGLGDLACEEQDPTVWSLEDGDYVFRRFAVNGVVHASGMLQRLKDEGFIVDERSSEADEGWRFLSAPDAFNEGHALTVSLAAYSGDEVGKNALRGWPPCVVPASGIVLVFIKAR